MKHIPRPKHLTEALATCQYIQELESDRLAMEHTIGVQQMTIEKLEKKLALYEAQSTYPRGKE